jgi:hypothetical protein
VSATDLEPTARRLYRFLAVVSTVGVVAAAAVGGWPDALGFAVGAAFSALNLWLFHRLARRIGSLDADAGPQKTSALAFAFRYALFGLGAYAIVVYFQASVLAVLAGFLVSVAAAILNILYELLYGTRT